MIKLFALEDTSIGRVGILNSLKNFPIIHKLSRVEFESEMNEWTKIKSYKVELVYDFCK